MKLNKVLPFMDINGYLLAWFYNQPHVIKLNGCDDWFLPIFSTVAKLHEHLDHVSRKLNTKPPPYTIKKIDDGKEFFDSVYGQARIMVDPVVISDDHTKWVEIMKQADALVFIERQLNDNC